MSEHAAPAAEGAPEAKKKGGKLPLMIGLVLLIIGLSVAGKVVLGGKKEETKKTSKHKKSSDDEETKADKKGEASAHGESASNSDEEEEESDSEPPEEYIALDPEFTVNLSGGGDHYLRTMISLGVKKGYTKAQLEHHIAPLRDQIIQILSTKDIKTLNSPDGKKKLKKELLKKLNKCFHEEKGRVILEVCFTAFATQ